MPNISTTTTGIFPKVSYSSDVPSLRANLHKSDRGEISKEELEIIIQKNIERVVTEQVAAGIDLPTDGLMRWTDLFSPFVQAWDGITRRGIHRFYDTNTLYGEPVIESELEFQPSQNSTDFTIAQKFGAKKATLPGVFTFAAACVDTFYNDEKKLREVIATNLLEEAKALIEAGAEIIEIHEPELAWQSAVSSSQLADVEELYKKFGELGAKIIVVSYFRNFSNEIAESLAAAKVGIGIDFSKPTEIQDLDASLVQIGIVDSRETKLENFATLAERKADAIAKFPNAEIIFSTTSHVEYLPHEIALQKIKLLKNLK